jgi:uncharacterized membrane protein YwzB
MHHSWISPDQTFQALPSHAANRCTRGHCNTILVIAILFWSLQYSFGHCHTILVIAIQFWSLQYSFGHCNTVLVIAIQFWSLQYDFAQK